MKKLILILIACRLHAGDLREFSNDISRIQAGLEGNTLLHVAAFQKDYITASHELKKKGAIKRITAINDRGSTALDFAVSQHDAQMIATFCNAIKREFKILRKKRALRIAYSTTKERALKLAVTLKNQQTTQTLIHQLEKSEETSCCS